MEIRIGEKLFLLDNVQVQIIEAMLLSIGQVLRMLFYNSQKVKFV